MDRIKQFAREAHALSALVLLLAGIVGRLGVAATIRTVAAYWRNLCSISVCRSGSTTLRLRVLEWARFWSQSAWILVPPGLVWLACIVVGGWKHGFIGFAVCVYLGFSASTFFFTVMNGMCLLTDRICRNGLRGGGA